MTIRKLASGFFLVALAVRLGALLAYGVAAIFPDAVEYLTLAKNLVDSHTFGMVAGIPTAFRPPLYPFLIAMLWRGDAAPLIPLGILQALLGAGTVVLLYHIAHREFGRRLAIWTAALAAIHPFAAVYTARVMTETLLTFFVVVGVYFWGTRRSALAGIAFGLAALTHSVVLFFVVSLPFLALVPAFRRRLRSHLILAAACFAVVSPWTLRNAVVMHRFTLIADAGWRSNLFFGTIDVPLFTGNPWPVALADADRQKGSAQDSAGEAILGERALERIGTAPLHWLAVRAKGYPRLFYDTGEYLDLGDQSLNNIRKWTFCLLDFALIALAMTGCWLRRDRLTRCPHLWTFPAFILLAHLPMWTEARRLLPAIPCLIALAVAGMEAIAARRAKLGT